MNKAALLAACAGLACAQSIDFAPISPAEAGLDPPRLEAFRSTLAAHRTTGLIVIRRGRIALEWYAPEWNADRPHGTASMAKALVGGMSLAIAMSDGRISPDDLASKYIAGWSADPLKSKITIRQLATHTSGISDAEQDDIPHDQLPGWKGDFWKRTPDPFSIAVRQAPVLFEPGTQNAYSNPGMAALSYAITASLDGADIRTTLKERVLDPLGVPERQWSIGYGRAYEVDGLQLYANWGGASFTPRAAARIGQLMMLQGQWNGRELIRRDVVRKVLDRSGDAAPRAQRRRSRAGIRPRLVHQPGRHLARRPARHIRRSGRPAPGHRRRAQPGPHRRAQRRRVRRYQRGVLGAGLRTRREAADGGGSRARSLSSEPGDPRCRVRQRNPARSHRQRQLAADLGRRRCPVHVVWRRLRLRAPCGEKAGDGFRAHHRRPRRLSRRQFALGRRAHRQWRAKPEGQWHPDGGGRPLPLGAQRG